VSSLTKPDNYTQMQTLQFMQLTEKSLTILKVLSEKSCIYMKKWAILQLHFRAKHNNDLLANIIMTYQQNTASPD